MAYTLTTKSQVTLPKSIRDHLKVAPGDAVDFRISADGSVRVEPVRLGTSCSEEPGAEVVARFRRLRGTAPCGHTTDELMNMLRGYDDDAADPGFGGRPAGDRGEVIFVDTCVLLDVVTHPSAWSDWSDRMLASWSERGALGINDIVFAEFCAGYNALSQVEAAVEAMRLDVLALPREALFLASNAHRLYRRRGGNRASVLPDFLIGAHASVLRVPILTRDPRRFTHYFAGLEVVHPGRH